MFSELAVLYLFLGGAGAGTVAVCSILDLALVRQPFGYEAGYMPGPSAEVRARTLDFAFALGFVLLVVGVVCLMIDLGRLDRVASLFLSPHPTALTVGAYALTAMLILGAGLSLVRFMYLPDIPQAVVRAAEVVAVAVAFVAMVYTGMLLQSLGGVAIWKTPLIPALFLLSSLSCGVAAVFVVAPFAGTRNQPQLLMLAALSRFDALVIALEIVAAAAFVWWASSNAHPGAAASFATLVQGELSYAWWIGFGACGLAVPLAIELAAVGRANRDALRKALAIVAVLVLVGALCMRFTIVDSGVHRDMELQETSTVALENAPSE